MRKLGLRIEKRKTNKEIYHEGHEGHEEEKRFELRMDADGLDGRGWVEGTLMGIGDQLKI